MDNTLQAIVLGGLALLSLVAVILLLVQRTQLRRALENARRDQQLLGDQLLDALDDDDDVQNAWHTLENEEDLDR